MIIISPYAKQLRFGMTTPHPKNYPYWTELLGKIQQHVIQIGVHDEIPMVADFRPNLPMTELEKLVYECDTWIGVDSFFQHFCWDLGKRGIVLFGQSDPLIFGHPENINLLKDRKYLREKQFWMWEQTEYNPNAFVSPEVVYEALQTLNSA